MSYSSPLPAAQYLDVERLDQQGFATGLLDDGIDYCYAMRDFEERFAIMSRSEIKDNIAKIDAAGGWLERRVRKTKNQENEGSCVYNMLAQMMETKYNHHFGDDKWIELSPMSGYRNNASSARSGSSVTGALSWSLGYGLLPARTEANLELVNSGLFKHTHPSVGWSARFESGWQETAKLFRVDEYLKLTSIEAWFTALIMGFPCGGGRNSHAICHLRPLLDGNNLLSLYINSWGNWGATYPVSPLTGTAYGFAADSESKISVMVSRGAFCVCSMLVPPWHLALAA